METNSSCIKKQMMIFFGIAFVLPYMLGILMRYGYSNGIDLTVFPTAQMLYPAAGAILAILIMRKGDELIPRRFFICFLISAMLLMVCAIASVIAVGMPWNTISQVILFLGFELPHFFR